MPIIPSLAMEPTNWLRPGHGAMMHQKSSHRKTARCQNSNCPRDRRNDGHAAYIPRNSGLVQPFYLAFVSIYLA